MKVVYMLDIGNVLVKVDMIPVVSELLKSGLVYTKEEAVNAIMTGSMLVDSNLMTHENFFEMYFTRANPRYKKTICELWKNEILLEIDKDMVDFFSWRFNDVIFSSNISRAHMKILQSKNLFFKKANPGFSCNIGLCKPSYLFYEYLLKKYDYKLDCHALYSEKKEEICCVYIDDVAENLSAANDVFKNRGFEFGTIEFNLHSGDKNGLLDFLCELEGA